MVLLLTDIACCSSTLTVVLFFVLWHLLREKNEQTEWTILFKVERNYELGCQKLHFSVLMWCSLFTKCCERLLVFLPLQAKGLLYCRQQTSSASILMKYNQTNEPFALLFCSFWLPWAQSLSASMCEIDWRAGRQWQPALPCPSHSTVSDTEMLGE